MHIDLSSPVSNKSHIMTLRSSKQTQQVGICLDTSTASKKAVVSMLQHNYQFIEGPVMDWTVDDLLYARFQTWKFKYEKILKAGLTSLADAKKARLFLDDQYTKV